MNRRSLDDAPALSGPTWIGDPSADRSAAVLFQTTSSCPPSSSRRAIRLPIAPRPMTATRMGSKSLSQERKKLEASAV